MTRTIDRREVIKRGAVVGGLAWSAPLIQSIAAGANAQSAPGGTSPFCNNAKGDAPVPCSLVFTYTGGPCTGTTGEPIACCDTNAGGPGCPAGGVDIRARYGTSDRAAVQCFENVTCGQPITIGHGEKMNPNLYITVSDANAGCADTTESCPPSGTNHVVIHTSCSKPLPFGAHFGAFRLDGGSTC